jgi:MFS family permease
MSSSTDQPMRFRLEIAILAALVFLAMFNLTLIAPILPVFVIDRFDVTEVEGSWFITIEMLAYIIFAPIWGSISDKFGSRRIFIIIGLVGSALMYFLMTTAQSLMVLLGLRFIQGAVTVMAWSLVMTSALDLAPKKGIGKVMGMIGAAMMFGMALGAPVGGRVHDSFGIFAPLYMASIIFTGATIIALLFLREHAIHHKPDSIMDALKVLTSEKKLAIPFIYGFVDRFTVGFFVFVFPAFMASTYDSSPGEIGMLMAALLIPFAALQYPFGKLSDKIGRGKPLVIGSLLYGLLMCFIGVSSKSMVIPLMACCGILAAMMFPPSIALIGDIAPPEKRGTATGGFNLFGSLGFAIGPLVGGYVAFHYGYMSSFIVGGLSEVIVAVITVPFILRLALWHSG